MRLLVGHPKIELSTVTSRQKAGEYVHRIHPSLKGFIDITFSDMSIDRLGNTCDLVFTALPHGKSKEIVKDLYDLGIKIVDLSADFRLKNPKDYVKWYGWEHPFPELLSKSVYGVPRVTSCRYQTSSIGILPRLHGCHISSCDKTFNRK